MTATTETKVAMPDYYSLLAQAVTEPGELHTAYRFFKQYSLTNRWLASTQMRKAGLPLSPINTFKGWLNLNRAVRKGEKAAIALIMPVPIKGKRKDADDSEEEGTPKLFTKFMLKNYWFHMAQTDGEEVAEAKIDDKEWRLDSALSFLEVTPVAFEFSGINDTKRTGYADGKTIAVSPLASNQTLSTLRQLASVVLGHTSASPSKAVPACDELRAVEAEAAVYLVAATLGINGLEESRAIIQGNLDGGVKLRIPDKCAHRAFSCADKIINAGYC